MNHAAALSDNDDMDSLFDAPDEPPTPNIRSSLAKRNMPPKKPTVPRNYKANKAGKVVFVDNHRDEPLPTSVKLTTSQRLKGISKDDLAALGPIKKNKEPSINVVEPEVDGVVGDAEAAHTT
jgi:hypothetical protein